MSSLIDITSKIQSIIDAITEAGGEISEESFAELAEFKGALEDKAVSIAYVVKSIMESRINRLKDIEAQAKQKRQIEENAQNRLKEYLKRAMIATNTEKVKGDLYSVTLTKGRERVEIVNSSEIPNEYIETTITTTPKKKEIMEAWKNGTEVPGTKIVTGDKGLLIK
jgi:hypothetical protein